MGSKTKELLHNPKFLYSAAIFLSLFLIVTCADLYGAVKHNQEIVDFSDIEINLGEGISANEFRYNIFIQGIQEDLDRGTSPEAIKLKFKYFYGVELR